MKVWGEKKKRQSTHFTAVSRLKEEHSDSGMGTSSEGKSWEYLIIVALTNILYCETSARFFITEIRCISGSLGHLASMSYFWRSLQATVFKFCF